MVITSENAKNLNSTANNIVPGGGDHSTLSHIILNQFGDSLESADFYMPEDSPFCLAFDDLKFTPPIHDVEFMVRSDWATLAKMSGYYNNRLTAVFEAFDIILAINLKNDSSKEFDSEEKLERFMAYMHTYLFRIIKSHMSYLAGLNRISQAMLASFEAETIFPVLVNELGNLIKFCQITLVTYHPEFDSFRVEAEYEREGEECSFKKQFLKLTETRLAQLIDEKRGMVARSGDLGQGVLAQRMIRAGMHSFLFAPIFANGELMACLIIASRVLDRYEEGDLERLKPVCELIGGVLRAALNYSQLQQFDRDYADAQRHFLHLEKYRNFIDITRGVLHAFNNHLALIMGRAQILSQFSGETITREAAEKGLNIILNASTKASEQIAQLQKYARLKPDDDPDQIQVKGLIEEIIELSMPRWKAIAHGSIDFDVKIDSQINFVGYRKKIKEVLINILMNAVESEEKDGGEISITAEAREEMAVINIRDNGNGIPRDEIARVFNPFYSTKPNGTGLGLAVSYKIIREHGGNIEIESIPKKGTLVRIFLPIIHRGGLLSDAEANAIKIENAVLVAPNRIQRNLLAGMLGKMGIHVKSAKSLATGEKMIVDENPQLVVLDDNLRDGIALEYLGLIRKNNPKIRTCLIGAPADDDEIRRLRSLGIDSLFVKPFEQSQIAKAVSELSRRMARDEEPEE